MDYKQINQEIQQEEQQIMQNQSSSLKQSESNPQVQDGYCQVCETHFKPVKYQEQAEFSNQSSICQEMIFKICLTCLDSWIKQQLDSQSVIHQDYIKIKCPIGNCNQMSQLQSILKITDMNQFPQTNEQLFNNYCKQSLDIVNCPNHLCNNRGIVQNKSCKLPLVCSSCKQEWYESSQNSFLNSFKNLKELKSNLYKYLFTKNCPQCQSPIQKNGGCNNMTCRKCTAHFCWLCLNLNNKHPITCGLRIAFRSLLIFSPIAYLFKKQGYFKLAKEYNIIIKSQRWYDYILYPFRVFGVGLRFGCYYAFCISSGFCLYGSGLLISQMINKIKVKLTNWYNKLVNKPLITENANINNNVKSMAKAAPYLAGGLVFSGFISYFFGNKTEYKIFFGANALYLSLIASVLVSQSF